MDDLLQSGTEPDRTAKFRALFFEEAADLLQDAELCLQKSADAISDADVAAVLFRSAHSIKSGAASFGMRRVVAFAHSLEETLEELRHGSFVLDKLRRHMFMRGYDMLAKLLAAEASQQAVADDAEVELMGAFEGLSNAATAVRSDKERQNVLQVMELAPVKANTAIRIELAKIDRLVNLASELTILESMLRQRTETLLNVAGQSGGEGAHLLQGLDQLSQQLRDLHHATMGARAQPLDNVFQRLPRLVRELAHSLDKRVELTVIGGEVEVDKTIIEQLAEPLTHILRNAVGHGIEAAALRQAQGKPLEGSIVLEARCVDNRLSVSIRDDGTGLDIARLREKALALGINTADEAAVADSIFLPGLSTAHEVSELSGRGVGLDAVRHSLAGMGGTITVGCTAGQGTCFDISLPLTLAVMDGMVVGIGDELYVLPMSDVQEALHVPPHALVARAGLPPLVRHQGRYIPLVDTGLLLGYHRPRISPVNNGVVLVAIVGTAAASVGLRIDHILAQQQIVIRSVQLTDKARPLSATILGDGRVALILSAAQIMTALRQSQVAA